MLLETLLHERGGAEITHIFKRKNVVFFKIHNESFCTAAGKIAHQSSHVYDSSFLHTLADEAHDEETQKLMQNETDRWMKHRADAMKLLMDLALKALADKGPEMMMKFLDEHLDLYPTDATMKNIVKRIEKGE
jgi:hypothetical protein